MRKTLHIADSWDAKRRVPRSELIVAVSPRACYELARCGQPARPIDEFYSADDVVGCEEPYWQEQLSWLDTLDAYLAAHVPTLALSGIQPADLYFYCLKRAIDQFYICHVQLRSLLGSLRPQRVVVHSSFPATAYPLNPTLWYPLGSHYRLLLPRLCAEEEIACEVTPVSLDGLGSGRRGRWRSATARLTEATARRWHQLMVRLRQQQRATGAWDRRRDERLTFLATGCWGEVASFVRDACRRGHRCFSVKDDTLFDVTAGAWNRKVATLVDSAQWWSSRDGMEIWNEASQRLKETPELYEWIQRRCGCAGLALVLPQLEYFVAEVAPRIVSSASQLSDVFRERAVDALVNTGLTTIDDAGAMAAAQQVSCPAFYVMHGEGAWQTVLWSRESRFYNGVFARHGEVARYYATWCRPDTVRVGSYALARLERDGSRAAEMLRTGRRRPLLIFAPAAMDWWYLHLPFVSPTWYFALQRRLVDLFVQRSDYRVIYKSSPWFIYHEAIASYIADQHAKHVRVDTRPFVEWLPRAERVVIDFASTIVSECLAYGTPFHVLCPRGFAMRPAMRSLLDGHVSEFTTPEEAVAALTRYLDGPAIVPPKLELAPQSICEQLECLLRARQEAGVSRRQPVVGKGEPQAAMAS